MLLQVREENIFHFMSIPNCNYIGHTDRKQVSVAVGSGQ